MRASAFVCFSCMARTVKPLLGVPPEKIHVVYCDAGINRVEEFTEDDLPLKLTPTGGGGRRCKGPMPWLFP